MPEKVSKYTYEIGDGNWGTIFMTEDKPLLPNAAVQDYLDRHRSDPIANPLYEKQPMSMYRADGGLFKFFTVEINLKTLEYTVEDPCSFPGKPLIDEEEWKEFGIHNYKVFPVNICDKEWHILNCLGVLPVRKHKEMVYRLGPYYANQDVVGLCSYNRSSRVIALFFADTSVGTITHEVTHAVKALFYNHFNLDLNNDNNELYAEAVSKLTELCMDVCDK